MTWTITKTTTLSASRAVTLAERIPGEPIKLIVLHPGTGAGGAVTIWDDLGRSVASTRIDALNPRHEAEFYSDRSVFNVSAAIDGNATLSGAGVSVYLVSREAPDASVADGTLVSSVPIVSPVLSFSQKWAEVYAGASASAVYWTPYDPLFIPANSFGPNSPAKRLLINGYYNLRGNTSSAGTWDSVSIGLYLDQAKTAANSAQKIAGTSLNLPIPAGLTTRYGAFTAELSYIIHEGQTNFTQSLMYSNRIGSMNDWDKNLEVLDSYLENGNPIDWTVDHYLYTSWRVQNGTQTLVIGSRYIEARL